MILQDTLVQSEIYCIFLKIHQQNRNAKLKTESSQMNSCVLLGTKFTKCK